MKRIQSIDLLRGVIITIMAIDHTSYFVAKTHFSEFWGVEIIPYDSFIWLFTRIITHVCAPGFFFLMGISIVFLVQSRLKMGWNNSQILKFLLIRGFLLILIGLFLETPAWAMGEAFSSVEIDTGILPGIEGAIFGYFGVLSSLGASMIISSLLIKIDKKWLLIFSVIGIIASYFYVYRLPIQFDKSRYFSSILLIPGSWPPIRVTYSVLPWLWICLLGVVWGKFYKENPDRIFRYTFIIGLFMFFLFIILRFLHFGNFQLDQYHNLMSFLTLIKYPASISFILFTLGIILIILNIFSNLKPISVNNPIITFGRTALFFYIIHLYIYLLLGFLFPNGTNSSIMYITWLGGLVILYFICLRYYRFKLKMDDNSIWRFF